MLSLCGGKLEIFERALPILKTYSADVVHLGDVGAGQFGKALNNFLLWVNGIALIEAGRLSEANGMDLVKLRETLLISSGASDALKNWTTCPSPGPSRTCRSSARWRQSRPGAADRGAIKELVKTACGSSAAIRRIGRGVINDDCGDNSPPLAPKNVAARVRLRRVHSLRRQADVKARALGQVCRRPYAPPWVR